MPRLSRTAAANKSRRDDILDHATRLFAERGYEGTSMGDLADRCGIRKASLFYHFESKETLYAAVLERLVRAVAAVIFQAASAEGSFPERLDTLTDAITQVLGEQPFAARLILREAMDWGPMIQRALGDAIEEVFGVAESFVRGGQEAGAFARGEPKQLLLSLIGIHFIPFGIGRVVHRLLGKDPFDPEFIVLRKDAVRAEVRALVLAKPTAKEAPAPAPARPKSRK